MNYSFNHKRYYTLDSFYKKKFNKKVFKVSLNAGFSCPNIDGKVGYGGCIYCSKLGSGDFAGNKEKSLKEQFNDIKNSLLKKWPNSLYIAYFQAHTNTYAPVNILKEKYESVLSIPNVVGINIATRPDAIDDECLRYLEHLNKKTYLTIELGLQTIHDETTKLINRCHSLNCFEQMVKKLRQRKINVVVHIINGLPYETKEMMMQTAIYLNKLDIQGIKIHMLHILKDTALEKMYYETKFHILSKDEYIDIVCSQLEVLNDSIAIHRITGDPNTNDLIEPLWVQKKFCILNDIDKELTKRKTYQGFKLKLSNKFETLISHLKQNELVIVESKNTEYKNIIETFCSNKVNYDIYYKNKISLIFLDYDKNKLPYLKKYMQLLNPIGMLFILINNKNDLEKLDSLIKNKKIYHTPFDDDYYLCQIF